MLLKEFETDRLLIKNPTMREQKRLWEILTIKEVNRYYFPTPNRIFDKNDLSKDKKEDLIKAREIFMEQFCDWERQEPFYKKKVDNIVLGDEPTYLWSIFLKTGEVIGQMSVQEKDGYEDNKNVRDVGWYLDPMYHGNGYMTKAAKVVLDYMFNEVKIEKIMTSAATINPASYKVMEKLGFRRTGTKTSTYFDDDNNILDCYTYEITREEYLNK